MYYFDVNLVKDNILRPSSSLNQPLKSLNYAKNYLADILPSYKQRIIYLSSDLVVMDDIAKLWVTEYCHANFTKYFMIYDLIPFYKRLLSRKGCYFNTCVMVIDLVKW
eukprot:Gb_18559 [translate_table: standard]